MKTTKLILFAGFCMFLSTAYSQEFGVDTTQNPVRQGDPAIRQSPEQMRKNDLRDMIKISADDIPASMQHALKGSDYKGQSKNFYRNKSGDTYLVEIQDGNITNTYRFDKQGKQINSNK